ncbi:MAG: nucleotidyltransferase domain-containing protein [Bacteroidetes bacterium]|nr:nucleotidyltransferase domain-containing protein [Bacteroidota bacterium]
MKITKETLKKLKHLLIKNFGDNIKDVILFGSQATETATDLSDYDILIVLRNEYDWKYKDKIRDVICEFEIMNDIFIDMNIISEKERNTLRWHQPIFINAFKNGIYA